mgnify:FL=1
MNQEDSKYVSNVLKKYQSYEKRYMISMDSMLYDIESNHDITYFDIPLYGNFGYNGINYMKDLILSEHDSYFFVQDSGNSQFANELCDFVRENGELIEEIEGYQIYYIS